MDDFIAFADWMRCLCVYHGKEIFFLFHCGERERERGGGGGRCPITLNTNPSVGLAYLAFACPK